MVVSIIERIVALCVRWPWTVLVLALGLTALSGYVAVDRFTINTDTARLISPDIPWRRNETALDKAFPQRTDLIVAVVPRLRSSTRRPSAWQGRCPPTPR